MSLISAGSISLESTFNVCYDRYGRGGPPQPPSPVHQNVADLASLMELKVGTRCCSTLIFHLLANCASGFGLMQGKEAMGHGLDCYEFDKAALVLETRPLQNMVTVIASFLVS
jgi:hypothetical protein